VRGPAEPPFGEAERLAVDQALALLKSGDAEARQLATPAIAARGPVGAQHQGEPRVWSVLTVDVVDGRIQAVRIVRNPDKLAHL
jgi:RNA polymerase sigma-70 factor, ECF subfamily